MKALIVWFLTVVAIMVLSFGSLYTYAVCDVDQKVIMVIYLLSLIAIVATFICYNARSDS